MRRRPETSRRAEVSRAGTRGAGGFDERRGSVTWRRVRVGVYVVTLCVLAWQATHLRFNLSPCLPRGVYSLTYGDAVRTGELVLACPPARAAELALRRHYLLPGSCPGGTKPIGKLVAALAGDRLDLAPGETTVNGQALSSTAILAVDSGGRPLPRQPVGLRRIAAGEVWLLSAHARSFDSRYFGPIGAGQVLGTMTPLITAGGVDPTPLAAQIRRAHHNGASTRCPPSRGPRALRGSSPLWPNPRIESAIAH
jgi:conjugative transfer signal peptidase TraF